LEFVNSSGAGGLALVGMLFAAPACAVVAYGLLIVVCLLLQSCFRRVPPEYRQMAPGKVWLLLIPCFNLLWLFVVCSKLARSFKLCFDAHMITDVGSCGYTLSLAWCITTCLLNLIVCTFPSAGFVPLAEGVIRTASEHPGDAGIWYVALALMVVDVVNPIPLTMCLLALMASSHVAVLVPIVVLAELVLTFVTFIRLRNRIGNLS